MSRMKNVFVDFPILAHSAQYCWQNAMVELANWQNEHSAHSASLLTLPFRSAHSASSLTLPFRSAHSASSLALPACIRINLHNYFFKVSLITAKRKNVVIFPDKIIVG